MKELFTFILACSIACTTIASSPAEFHVSPEGSDSNSGTLSEPFKTIEKARNAVRKINTSMKNDITVYLRGGRYIPEQTLEFDARDSGANGFNVIYKAYNDEVPEISGGKKVTNWKPAGDGLYKARIDAQFRQLYVNGNRCIRARTPNVGDYYRIKFWNERDRDIIIDKNLIQDWQHFDQVEMVPQLHWAEAILPLDSFEVKGPYAYVVPREPERDLVFRRLYPIKDENEGFHFENAFEFIDQPGEWYHDQESKILYYKPRPGETCSTLDAVIPQLETLVHINGTLDKPVHHLQLRGIRFSHAGWNLPRDTGMLNTQAGHYSVRVEPDNRQYFKRPPAAVLVNGAHHLAFDRNVFTNMGSTALDLYFGTHDNRITGNVFFDISGTGIMYAKFSEEHELHTNVYNPDDSREICRNDTIANNIITRVALDYPGCCGIACGFPQGVIIEHNEVYDLPYTGISVGWSWMDKDNVMRDNQVRYNHIHHVLQLLCDGGGVYTLAKQPNSSIKENYIHDINRSEWAIGSQCNGIFLDEGSNGYTIEHNVFRNIQHELIRHNKSSTIIMIQNYSRDQEVIDNAGLQKEYWDIRPLVN